MLAAAGVDDDADAPVALAFLAAAAVFRVMPFFFIASFTAGFFVIASLPGMKSKSLVGCAVVAVCAGLDALPLLRPGLDDRPAFP